MARSMPQRAAVYLPAMVICILVASQLGSRLRSLEFFGVFAAGMGFGIGLFGLIPTLRDRPGTDSQI